MKTLICNKCDIPKREVTTQEGEAYAKKHNYNYMELSAKTGHNVQEAVKAMVVEIYRR